MDPLVEDSIDCLSQGLRLLRQFPPDIYVYQSPETLDASIGAHFRHNIDHYECFLAGWEEGRIDYDHRERDEVVETSSAAAIGRMQAIADQLEARVGADLDNPLRVKMDSGSDSSAALWSQSSARRELQFLLSHTIHHYALIAVICRMHDLKPEAGFGVAPSTLRHRAQQQQQQQQAGTPSA